MITSFIHHHSRAAAFLSVLLLAVAAPYLVHGNPDSQLFHQGLFPLLLMLACMRPFSSAFAHASWKDFLPCAVLGLSFSLALSLGAELAVYGELLPGTGSMLRRIAVPVFSAPFFGMLFYLLAEKAFSPSSTSLSFPIAALLLFVCWLPILLAYWPGMLNYDFATEYNQYVSGQYSSIHPIFHSVLMNSILAWGEKLSSPNLGLLFMSLIQMVCLACALARSCTLAADNDVPPALCILLFLFYALHPVFSVMSVSMTKDTLFTAAFVFFILEVFSLCKSPDLWSGRHTLRLALLGSLIVLLRPNGVIVLLFALPSLFFRLRNRRRQALTVMVLTFLLSTCTTYSLNALYRPSSMPSSQLYSIPAQQLVRAYQSGKLTPAECEEIRDWYTSDEGLILHPHLADPAKGYLDRSKLADSASGFLELWLQIGKKCPREYLEAFLLLNIGQWYIDDESHRTIYPDVSYNDKGYLQTQEYQIEGFETTSHLPALTALFERICRRNVYAKYPLIPLLFSPAVPFWLILLTFLLFRFRSSPHLRPALAGALGLWLSYLFGACTQARYMLPLFAIAPCLFLTACFLKKEDLT